MVGCLPNVGDLRVRELPPLRGYSTEGPSARVQRRYRAREHGVHQQERSIADGVLRRGPPEYCQQFI